jgi:hypothetical protein
MILETRACLVPGTTELTDRHEPGPHDNAEALHPAEGQLTTRLISVRLWLSSQPGRPTDKLRSRHLHSVIDGIRPVEQ